MRIVRRLGIAIVAAFACAPSASACLQVGVYQDDPARTLAPLERTVGSGIKAVSTYVTAGQLVDPALVDLANRRKLTLLVSWLPDGGKDGAAQAGYRLTAVSKGKLDSSLRSLARQLASVKGQVIFRPMPEPNTPWYAWSGLVNSNKPSDYVVAWKHVRKVVPAAGAKRVKFLWTPYARSVPDSGPNAISTYFPGAKEVDFVGASAYNFGAKAGLSWTEPVGLFSQVYATIQALAPKPFWIAETASTSIGGDKAAWIGSLASLTSTMPKLAGIVWFDVKDGNGDFRLAGKPVAAAFKSLLRKGCR